jgi:photosystem II stability/assembly factor-like uncharacterized protein
MNDYLDQVEAQLAELTDRGAHRRLRARRPGLGGGGNPSGGSRPPRRTEALALLSAAAVAIAVVAIVVLNVGTSKPQRTSAPATASGSRHSTTAEPPTTNPPAPQTTSPSVSGAAPLPSHFAPQSFTAISELTWWVVGPAPCSLVGLQPPCGAILRTTDGGRNFTALEAPRATLAGRLSSSGYSQIRFADMRNGFAYGPDLYATHDGGTTWAPVDAGGDVIDLAIADGEVYATVSPNGSDSGRLMRSPVGQDQWTKVAAAGEVSGGLWVLGNEVIVQSGNGGGSGADLLVSTDGGASFGSAPAPSPGLPCDFQAQSPPIIWAQCATGTESGVWRSTDSGKNFVTAHGSGLPPLPNSAVLGAASDTTAVVGYQQLYRTSDAGASWTPTGPSGVAQWTYVGFTDATHGVALGYLGSIAPANQRLYYTTDGGQTYHLVPLP